MIYSADTNRYSSMEYRRAGKSGVKLSKIALGFWHNFGDVNTLDNSRSLMRYAFDKGVNYFDLADNYGPSYGSAEETFGIIYQKDFKPYRDEMFIATKAGHDMWEGVYGTGSSRKNIIASCDQSLKRCKLDYFDIFYSHRYDGVTPVEETMEALIQLVRQGKALYVGISKYPPDKQQQAYDILKEAKVPCLLSQYRYSMFDRKYCRDNFQIAADNGSGIICFSPLAQGLLTGKYSNGIPEGSRAAKESGFLKAYQVTIPRIEAAKKLEAIAANRGQTLAQMALAWDLADSRVTSVIIGTSSVKQMDSNLKAIDNLDFTPEEIKRIDDILSNPELSF